VCNLTHNIHYPTLATISHNIMGHDPLGEFEELVERFCRPMAGRPRGWHPPLPPGGVRNNNPSRFGTRRHKRAFPSMVTR
jgi:hypothetical protein